MFEEGQLLFFDPFFFKNGTHKPKFFIVLKDLEDNYILASLPTSQDHLPDKFSNVEGCVKEDNSRLSAFVFNKDVLITETFSFQKRTYIYGEQLDEYSKLHLDNFHSKIEVKGKIKTHLYEQLIECFKNSSVVKNKYKKIL